MKSGKSTISDDSPLKGAAPLLPYQAAWVKDDSRLKIGSKPRQAGFSFCSSLRAVLKCLERRMIWIFLSAGERQSKLLMEKVNDHVRAAGVVGEYIESSFMEGTLTKQLEVRFGNGSVIYGLPANPDTARGYSGNVTLDEFALVADQDKIYTALYPSITRGYGIEIISTPNGKQGKFYEFCKRAGLVDGEDADPNSPWSAHRLDIYQAAAQGLADAVPVSDSKIDEKILAQISIGFIERGLRASTRMLRFVAELRAGIDFEDDWMQEYCCQFVSIAENFFPPELLKMATSAEARVALPMALIVREPGEFFLGVDIGRHHDRTVFWLDRVTTISPVAPDAPSKRVAVTRLVRTLDRIPFHEQLQVAREMLAYRGERSQPLVRRCCIDATGMGAPLAEQLQREFGGRVEPVTFTALVKEDMAHRTKRLMENGQVLLPEAPEVHRAFAAIKKVVLPSGAIRFDAERTEAGHADQFWAKALADLAADSPVSSLSDGAIHGVPRHPDAMIERMNYAEF